MPLYAQVPTPAKTPTTKKPVKQTTPSTATRAVVFLEADERTNRILMIGLDEQLDIVEKLIDTLDVKQLDLRTLRSYEIQFVDAEDVLIKLEELAIVGQAGRSSYDRGRDRGRGRLSAALGRHEAVVIASDIDHQFIGQTL